MTKRLRKKFWRLERGYGERPAVGSGEVGSAIGQKPAADEQSYLGPYPVAKLLPTFDNLTFRKLRSTVQADRHPMTQKEHGEYIKLKGDTKRRVQQEQKLRKKRQRLEEVRKKRREEHERNALSRRARGLPSRNSLRQLHEEREDANRIKRLTEKISGFPKRKKKTAHLAKIENKSCLKGDEEEGWEDSDDDEEYDEEEDNDCGDDYDYEEHGGHGEYEEMGYDDASSEVTAISRKWGKWFNSVRKDNEGDGEIS